MTVGQALVSQIARLSRADVAMWSLGADRGMPNAAWVNIPNNIVIAGEFIVMSYDIQGWPESFWKFIALGIHIANTPGVEITDKRDPLPEGFECL